MTTKLERLNAALATALGARISSITTALGEITVVVSADDYLAAAQILRDDPQLRFEQLVDLCGVDYSSYGEGAHPGPRFAVVAHLLSVTDATRGRPSSGVNVRTRKRQLCVADRRCATTAKRGPGCAPSP
jgi:NADH-quinone oxidoreductase subunit C